MGTTITETVIGKVMLQRHNAKLPILKHQTVKRKFTVKRADSNNMPQKSSIRRCM